MKYIFIFFIFYCFHSIADAQVAVMDTVPENKRDSVISIASENNADDKFGKDYTKFNKEFIAGGISDGLYAASRPLQWQKKDWLKFSAVMSGVGAGIIFDKKIRCIALHNQNNFTNSIATTVEPFGNLYGLYVFPALYATGIVTGSKRVQSIGLKGGKALVISTVIYTASKKIIRRRRPDEAESQFDYAVPFTKKRYTSSPSGHTNTIFTVATVFAEEFRNVKWVAPVAYSIASLTAVSRIYHNRHWSSDVLLGAALGHFVTKAVYYNARKRYKILKTFQ